ncbi:MAG: hypothetical protein CH6_3859 [Candidatus Kapaibacterium sp.]|nr:MAG: hypothetical protein CH6_3859 [Candidatus Kapabacteria bacterium]
MLIIESSSQNIYIFKNLITCLNWAKLTTDKLKKSKYNHKTQK